MNSLLLEDYSTEGKGYDMWEELREAEVLFCSDGTVTTSDDPELR